MGSEDLSFWLSWCVEEYAAEKNLSAPEVSDMFEKKAVYSYLNDNAEILHTQGKNYILASIDDFISSSPDN